MLFTAIAALLLLCLPQWRLLAATQEEVRASAARDYHEGHVIGAISALVGALAQDLEPKDRYLAAELLMEICADSLDYQCLVNSINQMDEASKAINTPAITAPTIVYGIALAYALAGDLDSIERNFGWDFAIKFADPIRDPSLATRFFLLAANLESYRGNYASSYAYVSRAFASLLRLSPNQKFYAAKFLHELIDVLAANQYTAQAIQWADISDAFIRSTLPPKGLEYAQYLATYATLHIYLNDFNRYIHALREAQDALKKVQVRDDYKDYLVANLAIQEVAAQVVSGDIAGANSALAGHPYSRRRDELLAAGRFSNLQELLYALGNLFVSIAAGHEPEQRWSAAFETPVTWKTYGAGERVVAAYTHYGLALLNVHKDKDRSKTELRAAAESRLDFFETTFSQAPGAAPLPSMVDRIVIGSAIVGLGSENETDADLLVRGMELLNRSPRYAISDTLSLLAARSEEDGRRLLHSWIRINDDQSEWQAAKLREFIARMTNPSASDSPNNPFYPQFTMTQFAHLQEALLDRLKGEHNVFSAEAQLPSLHALRTALLDNEAFIGYAAGAKRVCIRKTGLWTSPLQLDLRKVSTDVRLMAAALTADYPPSDSLDSQYPVKPAVELYHALFDGLEACLRGATHLIFQPPADFLGVPLAALLMDEPPSDQDRYDFSSAPWLLKRFDISYVTSIQNLISARTLAARASGDRMFLGIGDPRLNILLGTTGNTAGRDLARKSTPSIAGAISELSELPETGVELNAIARILAPFKPDILLGDDATEERFRSLSLDRYTIMQFATHGLIREDLPGLSEAALVLTPGNLGDSSNDGLLTAGEIASLSLRARLVVLSACNTANFDLSAFAQHVQGLTTAFAVAGVPTTIASLWPVESNTSQRIMTRFYSRLVSAQNITVAAALRAATEDALREAPSPAFRHPRFWAPFIVLGDGATALRKTAIPPSLQSFAEVTPGGGEILAAAPADLDVITSEIGPLGQSRSPSFVRRRTLDGRILWSIEDGKIGAGALVKAGNAYIAAGYLWNEGRSTLVLRSVSASGKRLWQRDVKSDYSSSRWGALVPLPNGGFVGLIAPFVPDQDKDSFELIKYDDAGAEVARARISLPPGRPSDYGWWGAASIVGPNLFVAVNGQQRIAGGAQRRNDFGYVELCNDPGGAEIFVIDTRSLKVLREGYAKAIEISSLLDDGSGRPIVLGAARDWCDVLNKKALIGAFDAGLSFYSIWTDDGPFPSGLTSGIRTENGILAVGSIQRTLAIQEPHVNADGSLSMDIPAPTKHPVYQMNMVGEGLILHMNKDDVIARKEFLSYGLPLNLSGIVEAKFGTLAFGDVGFNPWMGHWQ